MIRDDTADDQTMNDLPTWMTNERAHAVQLLQAHTQCATLIVDMGQAIRLTRERRQLSARKLAALIGTDAPTLSRVETGQMLLPALCLSRLVLWIGTVECDSGATVTA